MSIFAKPISGLTFDDLQELVTERAVENVRLEFKRDVPDKAETLKKLSSFANILGGYMYLWELRLATTDGSPRSAACPHSLATSRL